MTFSQPKFKALQKRWYKKLAQNGFDDIETEMGQLKSWESFRVKKHDSTIPEKELYYTLCRQFLQEHEFKYLVKIHPRRIRKIFEKHVEGMSYRNIAKKHGLDKNTVATIIQRLRKLMVRND